jgi:hypothetical protein
VPWRIERSRIILRRADWLAAQARRPAASTTTSKPAVQKPLNVLTDDDLVRLPSERDLHNEFGWRP